MDCKRCKDTHEFKSQRIIYLVNTEVFCMFSIYQINYCSLYPIQICTFGDSNTVIMILARIYFPTVSSSWNITFVVTTLCQLSQSCYLFTSYSTTCMANLECNWSFSCPVFAHWNIWHFDHLYYRLPKSHRMTLEYAY